MSIQLNDRLTSQFDLFDSPPEGLTLNKVVVDPEFGQIKIRAYATEAEAKQVEAHIRTVQNEVNLPNFLGRSGSFLVFEYLDVEQIDSLDGGDAFYEIGKFLGSINQFEVDSVTQEKAEIEFIGWLRRFQAMHIIPAFVIGPAVQHYRAHCPQDPPFCVDHWDAMPHNFGWRSQKYYLLDEKHLRPSFPGVGLVKPYFLLSPQQWDRVYQGYQSENQPLFFDENRKFLEFYYLAAALYFYSLAIQAGRISPVENVRFLAYRDQFISISTNHQITSKILSELHLYATHPGSIPNLLKQRLRKTIDIGSMA